MDGDVTESDNVYQTRWQRWEKPIQNPEHFFPNGQIDDTTFPYKDCVVLYP